MASVGVSGAFTCENLVTRKTDLSSSLSSCASQWRGGSVQVFGRGLAPSKLCNTKKRGKIPGAKASLDHIPKQFRQENLKEGLMENFKNIPESLYGLNPSQMDMFLTEDSPIKRQADRVTEESITSAKHYSEGTGMWSLTGLKDGPSRLSMSVNMYRGGGGGGGYGRLRSAPPDLPSLLLDARILYLGMPIVPAVTELLIAELMWLDYDNPSKPVYFYINSPGTQNEKHEPIAFETEAYAIADTIAYVKPKVYTLNCGMAFGQAAMLLSLGTKGSRALMPSSTTKLHLPVVNKSSGSSVDMWIKAKELDVNTQYYIELLAKGIGKSKEEIAKDIQRSRYFFPQEAIDYGIADKILTKQGLSVEKRNYDEMLAQSKAARLKSGGAAGALASPAGRP